MYNPQLDTFIRVAEAGSFSKAAQESFITPTAVIKQMNLLESRLGLTLFHRSHQGFRLREQAGRCSPTPAISCSTLKNQSHAPASPSVEKSASSAWECRS